MSLSKSKTYFMVVLVVECIIAVQCLTTTTNKTCDKARHGKLRLYENRNGDDEVLICAKKNGVYRWRFLDGSSSLGEKFDPANDCTDIVDNKPNAKDDYYWVRNADGKVVKVWCDVHTDGGGFMLIGMQDNPCTWNISFNSTTINPTGPPMWSSQFGNLKIDEFAVQISATNNFEETKAHWLYKLNSKRQLGNLFGFGNGGCTKVHSGFGDIQYIKDVFANDVVNNNFNCSKFGPHMSPGLGWGRMNYCFRRGCQKGFAYFQDTSFKIDNYGSFSYSTVSEYSGITHASTAFVGCDTGKCCACFGPKGKRGNYCGTECKAMNGGTVLKQAFIWFWVRTSQPKRVWRRCMEFKMKSEQGNIESHFIDRATGSAHKGTCSDNFHAFLNEGTLSVSTEEDLKNVPHVPGLFTYCKENKRTFVNDGNEWNNLSHKKEVDKNVNDLKKLKKNIENLNNTLDALVREMFLPKSCAELYEKGERQDGVYMIRPDNQRKFMVRCDMTTDSGGWTVFQRRKDGSQDFFRGWSDYKNGFGDLDGEFWLGLDKIYRLTTIEKSLLRVDLGDFDGAKRHAIYDAFTVGAEREKYKLSLGSYSGSAGDSLSPHNGMMFTTKDQDNDQWNANCAMSWKGAWWYKGCYNSNLNGLYFPVPKTANTDGVNWQHWRRYSLKTTEMKLRPVQF